MNVIPLFIMINRDMRKTYKGKYKLKRPEKYMGDRNNVVYRSLWERNTFRFLEKRPWVKWWNSEGTIIRYVCSTDRKIHRYFVDLTIRTVSGDTYLVEIKPLSQTKPPKRKNLKEALTYMKNTSKWDAARKFCDDRPGYKFLIWTERELETMGIKTMTYKFKFSKTKVGKSLKKRYK
tara:strand:- start:606 stop:1136 length:531 start_codon:yes stop_codon:yes gene_type:complete